MGATDQAVTEEITRLELARAEAYLRRDVSTLGRLLPEHFTYNRAVGSWAPPVESRLVPREAVG